MAGGFPHLSFHQQLAAIAASLAQGHDFLPVAVGDEVGSPVFVLQHVVERFVVGLDSNAQACAAIALYIL